MTTTLAWNGPIITFVTPWYGEFVPGGAETACRRTAEELCRRGVAAEVFTTTAGGLMTDWTVAAFPAGRDEVNGVGVTRFPASSRDNGRFDALNRRLLHGGRLSLLEEAVFVREIVRSEPLDAAIRAERDRRVFVFIPYMFGTTYWGMRAAGRGYLIPCLHDEAYARMTVYRELIEQARGWLFLSPAEQTLARRMFRIDPDRSLLWGTGVETTIQPDPERFRARYGLNEPFLLYAGRRDATKNTPLLFEFFARYRAEGGPLRLVCIGGPGDPVPPALVESGAAVDLGFLAADEKFDAYAAATVVCQPSLNESFSLVMMESWVAHTPVLVHSDCAVTSSFCEQSGGGLWFRSYDEFAGSLEWLAEHPILAHQMGVAGGAYVRRHFSWDAITTRLITFLDHDLKRL